MAIVWGARSTVNLWNANAPYRSTPTVVVEEDEVEAPIQKEVDTTALLPKRDRSRNMGMHTECMARDCDMVHCTKYEKHRKKPTCTYKRFGFMCTWVSKEGYIR